MLLEEIRQRWLRNGVSSDSPVIRSAGEQIFLNDIAGADPGLSEQIPVGSVVAHIGDFTPRDIAVLLGLIDRKCVIAPLTAATAVQHESMFEAIGAEFVIREGTVDEREQVSLHHESIQKLRSRGSPGLILFSSGTTGAPKAALHDFGPFLDKFASYSRPALRTMAFLLFDHIGGINTLLHTLYNAGTIHVTRSRRPTDIIRQIADEGIELLPTTPSFLRLALVDGAFDDVDLSLLKLISYGTERMDQVTLDRLVGCLPEHVDLRQTYGMSELGIFPVRNKSRQELWIRIADPAIETQVRDGIMWIRSPHRMVGYLNAPSPFDDEGWFCTKDLVEFDGDYFMVLGRNDDLINVGGLKIHPREVEDATYRLPEVSQAKATGESDPLLGQHVRLAVELVKGAHLTRQEFRARLAEFLPRDKMPHRIAFEEIQITPRFKKA